MIDGADPTETWTAQECARAWGVKPATWLGYVSRGQAPAALPDKDAAGRRRWDAAQVRAFPRPGVGRSRAGAGPAAEALLAQMRAVAEQIEQLRATQRDLLRSGREADLEIMAMARASGISRQTAYSWLSPDQVSDQP